MFCIMLNCLLIAIYDSLTCTSLSDPSFHCRNVCDKCSVHQFFFYFVRSNSIDDWSTFLQKIRLICLKLVLFRSYIEYLHLSTIKTNTPEQCMETAETVKNVLMARTWTFTYYHNYLFRLRAKWPDMT